MYIYSCPFFSFCLVKVVLFRLLSIGRLFTVKKIILKRYFIATINIIIAVVLVDVDAVVVVAATSNIFNDTCSILLRFIFMLTQIHKQQMNVVRKRYLGSAFSACIPY